MADRRGSLSMGVRAIRRELGSQPAVVISILLAVTIAGVLISGAPRLLEQVTADDVHATISDSDPALGNVRVERFGRFGVGPDDDPMGAVREYGESFAERLFPSPLQEVVSSNYFVVDSPRFEVSPLPGEDPPHPFQMFLRFRYQEGIDEHSELVDGQMPSPQDPLPVLMGPECPSDRDELDSLRAAIDAGEEPESEAGEPLDCALELIPHYQVAVSSRTAEDMGLEIGQTMLLTPDRADQLLFGISGQALSFQLAMSISGIIALDEVSEDYWFSDETLHRPGIVENPDFRIIFATGLMSRADYGSMGSALGEARRAYVWRYFLSPELVADSDVGAFQSELVPFLVRYSPVAARPTEPRVITQLSDLFEAHVAQRAETVSMMSLTVAGLFTVVVAVVTVLAVLMTLRQTRSIVLSRNRGGSGGQITMTRLYEALLVVVPAGAMGFFVSAAFLPETDDLIPYRAIVVLVAAGVAALVLAVLPLSRQHLGDLQRDTSPRTSRGGRLVIEVTIVVVTIGAVLLLRRRGETDDPLEAIDFDWLLAATPALIGISTGIVALRTYPWAIRLLATIGSRLRGAVTFVGFRRVLQGPLSAWLPVLVIVICVASATYASVTSTSIDAGQQVSSWQVVGGDYSIEGFASDVNIPSSVDIDSLAGVDEIALARTYSGARLEQGRSDASTRVMALEAQNYSAVTTGTLGDVDLPSFLYDPPIAASGSTDDPIPVVVSDNWPNEMTVAVGSTFSLDLGSIDFTVVVGEVRQRFPDLSEDEPFVVLSYDRLRAMSSLPVPPTVAYVRAGPSVAEDLTTQVATQSSSARVISRYDFVDRITTDPFVSWVESGMVVVFWSAVVFAVVTAVSSLAISSATRRRDIGYLHTLGLDSSQATLMTAIEQVPPVLAGTFFGVVAGVLTSLALTPAMNLDAFTGDVVPTPTTIDWAPLTTMSFVLMGVMAAAVVIFVYVNRGDELGRVLRVGED